MGIMTGGAVSMSSFMLDRRALDLAGCFSVTSDTKLIRLSLAKDYMASLRRLVAGIASLPSIGSMRKLLDQLRSVGLVHVMATETISPVQRLPLVGFGNRLIFHVMTFHTPRSWIFYLVEFEFQRSRFPGLVYDVAGITPRI